MSNTGSAPGGSPSSPTSAETIQAKRFLEALFAGKPDPYHFCVFALPQQTTKFFQDVGQALPYIMQLSQAGADVYVQPAIFVSPVTRLSKTGRTHFVRGTKNNIDGMCALYADIDVASESHKKQDLPPGIEDAVDLVVNSVLRPTFLVHSGHGLHAWWVFKEAFIFENPQDRDYFESVCLSLQSVLRHAASSKGWSLDATHDLTRVLRIPGTLNRKDPQQPIPVTLLDDGGPFYNGPQDFEDYRSQSRALNSTSVVTQVTEDEKKTVGGNIVVNFEAKLPQQYHVMAANPKFRATWLGARPDFAKGSPSEYVMSLAVFGVQWGLNDQEIADLIVCWYKTHLNTPQFVNRDKPISLDKLKRNDYLAHTIAKARKLHASREALQEIDEHSGQNSQAIIETIDKDKAQQMLEALLGFKIIKIVKYVFPETQPTYTMETDQGEIRFPHPNDLLVLSRFSTQVFTVLDIPIDVKIKSTQWQVVKTLFKHFIVTKHIDDLEHTMEDHVRSMVDQYLTGKKARNILEVTTDQEPFIYKGNWHIFETPFHQFVFNVLGYPGTRTQLKTLLAKAGCAKRLYRPRDPKTKRQHKLICWAVPTRLVVPPPVAVCDDDMDVEICIPGDAAAAQ